MLSIKKALAILPVGLFVLPILTSCNNNGSGGSSKDGVTYLKVLNSEDYIYKYDEEEAKKGGNDKPDMIVQFEQHMKKEFNKEVRVIYDTFDTMENMYNTLKTGKTQYDVICASEYMIQKLASNNLIEKLDKSKINYYYNDDYEFGDEESHEKSYGCSPFIKDKLTKMPIVAGGNPTEGNRMHDYVVCYMWGTLGILYNPGYESYKNISLEDIQNDVKDWNVLWNSKYKKSIAIKDSMRDTYCIGLMHKYKNELDAAKGNYDERNRIFNYGGETDTKAKEHINTIKNDLLDLRKNVFGFEVDSGKQDIVTGKIGMDTAWSGDAVYSMDQGDEEKSATLYYSIPEEGTNLWFDCWCMQKGANKDVAQEFLNFISNPENANQNMEYIGYTSPIAGWDTFEYFSDTYDDPEAEEPTDYDVSYFYNGKNETGELNHTFTIAKSDTNRQIAAQFPHSSIQSKLMVMQDYGKNNDLILRMWEQVKHESLPNWAIALLSVEGAIAVGAVVVIVILKTSDKKRRNNRKKHKVAL